MADYTLTADTSAFSFTGIAAGLAAQRKLVIVVGAFVLTGVAAGVTAQRKTAPAVGAFTLTGSAAALTKQENISAGVGAFVLTGSAAGLSYGGHRIAPAVGAFVLTGNAAGLTDQENIKVSPGAFTLAGNTVNLVKNTAPAEVRQARTGGGMFHGLSATNVSGGTKYLYLFDSNGVSSGNLACAPLKVAAGDSVVVALAKPKPYANGLRMASSSASTPFTPSGSADFIFVLL